MKKHTSNFKEEIKLLGKQQDVRITYTINDEQIVLGSEDINSATPNYKASLLKSVMKGLDLDSNTDIPLGTEIKFEYGLLVNGAYEYLNYGNYIVYKSEKQEDTLSYKITCYDKMLYSMKDYEHIEITYPCTIKEYLIALCNKIGLEFKDSTFANQDREIQNELFMTTNEDGTYSSMGYTYRDILDQIAETTGGCICLTLDDKVEVRYVNKTINYEQSEKSNIIQFKTEVEEPIILERLEGKSIQVTRSGKNLYNKGNVSGTRMVEVPINELLAGTYTLSAVVTSSDTDRTQCLVLDATNNKTLGYLNRNVRSSFTFTLEKPTKKLNFYASTTYDLSNEDTFKFADIQIEQGTTATEYEQYGASPSPDYPSPIENVEGKNKFDINQEKEIFGIMLYKYSYYLKPNTKYTISSNCPASTTANIYANSNSSNSAVYINKNQTIQSDENGYFYILVRFKADASDNSTFNLYEKVLNGTYYIQLEEGIVATPYVPYNSLEIKDVGENLFDKKNNTILTWLTAAEITEEGSVCSKNFIPTTKNKIYATNFAACVFYYDKKLNYLGNSMDLRTDSGNPYTTWTNPDNNSIAFMKVEYRKSFNHNLDMTTQEIMLTESGIVKPYKPYQEQKIDFPLSEGQKLYEGSYLADDGIHHKRKQIVFDGSDDENWRFYPDKTHTFRASLPSISKTGICSHYKRITVPSAFDVDTGIYLQSSNSAIISDPRFSTVAEFKEWLQSNPITVEYGLATEEIVPYTEAQKTILTSIKTMKGTNIFEFPSDTIISYPINYDTIDEEYINNTNVSFGEKYGAINSIVLARAGESDKIYKKDQASIDENGLCELMISENQFMNFNDRSDYLQELSDNLFGVEYYLNDFTSTGIMYYDLLDVYNVKIGDKTYNCLMLNDEQDITQGLEENIYTERPEKSETDYTKADKTDQKINQTNLVVDKQNQKIEGIISQIGDRSEKTTTITADIDGLNSKVTNIADLTNTVSGIKTITLENCVEGRLLELNILGNNTVFDYLFPNNDLYPSNTLFTRGDSRITVTNYKNNSEESNSTRTYELGIVDVLRQKNNVYDEYILKEGKAQVIRRINKDGTIKDNEEIEYLGKYLIYLQEGTNIIEIQNYSAQIRAKFAIKSDYTDVFATKVEMNSEIKQTADEINLEVRKKVDENEIISKINQTAEAISIKADKINLNGAVTANENFKIKPDGSMETKNGTFTGGNISLSGGTNQNNAKFIIEDPTNNQKFAYITPNSIQAGDSSGNDGYFAFNEGVLNVGKGNNGSYLQLTQRDDGTRGKFYMSVTDAYVTQGSMHALEYHYDSLAQKKKNIKLYEKNAIDIIKNTDVYEFNYKSQEDNYKKNIGFVIGDNYRTSKEIFTNDKVGINSYSVLGVLWKAVQEQQEQIELLQEEINKLKGEN